MFLYFRKFHYVKNYVQNMLHIIISYNYQNICVLSFIQLEYLQSSRSYLINKRQIISVKYFRVKCQKLSTVIGRNISIKTFNV